MEDEPSGEIMDNISVPIIEGSERNLRYTEQIGKQGITTWEKY